MTARAPAAMRVHARDTARMARRPRRQKGRRGNSPPAQHRRRRRRTHRHTCTVPHKQAALQSIPSSPACPAALLILSASILPGPPPPSLLLPNRSSSPLLNHRPHTCFHRLIFRMKLGATFLVSLVALLLAPLAVKGCLTLTSSGKTQVRAGKSTHYKIRIAAERKNVTNLALTVSSFRQHPHTIACGDSFKHTKSSPPPSSSLPHISPSRSPFQKAYSTIPSPAIPNATLPLNLAPT